MLRSTMGSYGRPVIEVAYGETMIHSTEAIWEILAQEEWLRSTPMWAPYIIFFDFHDIKIYMYYVFKIYMYYKKENWWSLISSRPDNVQRRFLTVHEF